jgi:hypothetical protein
MQLIGAVTYFFIHSHSPSQLTERVYEGGEKEGDSSRMHACNRIGVAAAIYIPALNGEAYFTSVK